MTTSSGAVHPAAPVAPPAVEEEVFICTCLACRVSSIVIHTVVQMVRVVGLTDGPGFFVWVGGWLFLD